MAPMSHSIDRHLKHGRYHIIFTHSLERSNHSKLKPYKKADYLQTAKVQKLKPYKYTLSHTKKFKSSKRYILIVVFGALPISMSISKHGIEAS